MFNQLRNTHFRSGLKRAIKLATVAIYSEQFDMDAVVKRISGNDEPVQLLRAYVAIQIATQLTEPLKDSDIDIALEEFRSSEARVNQPDFEDILRLRKELAEIYWQQKTVEILERKLASQNNEYSYEAGVYQAEKGFGPTTAANKAEIKKLSATVEETEKHLNDCLNKEACRMEHEGETAESFAEESDNVEHYQGIVFAFSDLVAAHEPLIGDCRKLPHPKKTILYAIAWLRDHNETGLETAVNPNLREKYEGLIHAFNYLLTHLARDWHEIDEQDKGAIARLNEFESFPEWALPLKQKYICDETASREAAEATLEFMKDKVEREGGRANANDPRQNRI